MKERTMVQLGPFNGGLNLNGDTEIIADNELSRLRNAFVDEDGIIKRRWPIHACGAANGMPNSNLYQVKPLGTSGWSSDYELVSVRTIAADTSQIYAIVGAGSLQLYAAVVVGAGSFAGKISCKANYNGLSYFVPAEGSSGVGQSQNNTGSAYTAIAAMPQGSYCFIFKDRMWILNTTLSRVYYSKATDPTIWAAPDGGFFDVGKGLDDYLLDAFAIANDTIYLFKRNSTYSFNFTDDPGTDGYLQVISSDIGAIAACSFENNVYLINTESVYRMVNGQFIDIGKNLSMREPIGTNPNKTYVGSISNNITMVVLKGQLLIGGTTLRDTGVNTNNVHGLAVYTFANGTWSYWYPADNVEGASPYEMRDLNINTWYDYVVLSFYDPVAGTQRIGSVETNLGPQPDSKINSTPAFPRIVVKTKSYTFGDKFRWKRLKRAFLDILFLRYNEANDLTININQILDNTVVTTSSVITTITQLGEYNGLINLPSNRFRELQYEIDIPLVAAAFGKHFEIEIGTFNVELAGGAVDLTPLGV